MRGGRPYPYERANQVSKELFLQYRKNHSSSLFPPHPSPQRPVPAQGLAENKSRPPVQLLDFQAMIHRNFRYNTKTLRLSLALQGGLYPASFREPSHALFPSLPFTPFSSAFLSPFLFSRARLPAPAPPTFPFLAQGYELFPICSAS